ncbi:MAG: methyltransferase domain-containing protein [Bacillota bacterium]|nr:methyltransferase domain-containing protein [Bacillota bacterium]
MSNYEGLAKVYDMMMLGVDYEAWADYVLNAAATIGLKVEKCLDLACGTGSTTIPLAKRGIKMSAVDLSSAMLTIAKEKTAAEGLTIDYYEKNMLAMDFNSDFDMVVSFQDGINYLTGPGDFRRLAAEVKAALKPGGVFIFDLNLVDKYSDSETTVIDLDDMYMVYENNYDAAKKIWRIKVTGFLPEGDLYRRFEETHEEKNHDIQEVKEALADNGLEIFAIWDIFTQNPPSQNSKRILVVAKRREA